MILTEEELKEMNFGLLIEELRAEGCNFGVGKIEKLIDSHRHLFTANAELSFKNIVYKSALKNILKVDEDLAEYSLDVIENLAKQALEEDK